MRSWRERAIEWHAREALNRRARSCAALAFSLAALCAIVLGMALAQLPGAIGARGGNPHPAQQAFGSIVVGAWATLRGLKALDVARRSERRHRR